MRERERERERERQIMRAAELNGGGGGYDRYLPVVIDRHMHVNVISHDVRVH